MIMNTVYVIKTTISNANNHYDNSIQALQITDMNVFY